MKYYIYISDAKVDMLLPQISNDVKRKAATEYKVDMKIFSVSNKSEHEPLANRVTRLETVVNFIKEYGNLGSINNPDDYILDSIPMKMYIDKRLSLSWLVYFSGVMENTVVALGGSPGHLLGGSPPPANSPFPLASSHIWAISRWVEEYASGNEITMDEHTIDSAGYTASALHRSLKGPSIQLEFLAKRFFSGAVNELPNAGKVFIGSPLYVAMADVPETL